MGGWADGRMTWSQTTHNGEYISRIAPPHAHRVERDQNLTTVDCVHPNSPRENELLCPTLHQRYLPWPRRLPLLTAHVLRACQSS